MSGKLNKTTMTTPLISTKYLYATPSPEGMYNADEATLFDALNISAPSKKEYVKVELGTSLKKAEILEAAKDYRTLYSNLLNDYNNLVVNHNKKLKEVLVLTNHCHELFLGKNAEIKASGNATKQYNERIQELSDAKLTLEMENKELKLTWMDKLKRWWNGSMNA